MNLNYNDNDMHNMFRKEVAQRAISVMHRVGIIDDIFGIFDDNGNVKRSVDEKIEDIIETFDDVHRDIGLHIYSNNLDAYRAIHAIRHDAPFCGRSVIEMIKEKPSSIYEIQIYFNAFLAPYVRELRPSYPEDSWKDISGINIVIRTQREGGGDQTEEDFFSYRCKYLISKKLACLETVLRIPLLPDHIKCDEYCDDSMWAHNIIFPVDHEKLLLQKVLDACDVLITRVYYMKDMGIKFYLSKVIVDIDYNMSDGEITLITNRM
jgi:hypothetical protein